MRCHKSKFLIQIIVSNEHELIVDVIQGLSLSTASLVIFVLYRDFDLNQIVFSYEKVLRT